MAAQPQSAWALARRGVFSVAGLTGWGLYVIGLVELATAWPFQRPVGVATILLGLASHGFCIWRARGDAATYEWNTD